MRKGNVSIFLWEKMLTLTRFIVNLRFEESRANYFLSIFVFDLFVSSRVAEDFWLVTCHESKKTINFRFCYLFASFRPCNNFFRANLYCSWFETSWYISWRKIFKNCKYKRKFCCDWRIVTKCTDHQQSHTDSLLFYNNYQDSSLQNSITVM